MRLKYVFIGVCMLCIGVSIFVYVFNRFYIGLILVFIGLCKECEGFYKS